MEAIESVIKLVASGTPWLTYSAANWLSSVIRPGWRVWEWGCGGTTTFLLSKGCEVYSVEHFKDWLDLVRPHVKAAQCRRWHVRLVPPSQGTSEPVVLSTLVPGNFNEYVGAIEAWPTNHFDMVIVDGRARIDCAKSGLSHVRPGGWLVLDNSDRSRYQPIGAMLHNWRKLVFHGKGPPRNKTWTTTAWQKPA